MLLLALSHVRPDTTLMFMQTRIDAQLTSQTSERLPRPLTTEDLVLIVADLGDVVDAVSGPGEAVFDHPVSRL